MFKHSPNRDYWLSLFIVTSLLLTGLSPLSVSAQDRKRKPVVVSFGQPNIWSLEQAHYLLARMHMTNLDLQAKALADTDLDPNATHGTRIQILKQLLEVGAAFDQGIGFQNQRIVETARFNDDRRRNLTTNRDRLRSDSLKLELEINELKRERKNISDATSERAKDLDAQIEEKTKNQEKVDKEVTFHNDEIKTLGAEPSGTPGAPSVSPSPFDKTRLPTSVLDKLTDQELQKLLDPGRDPKLNATTMLDNTVQLQYEIIAKQLTLLRDEVGPGERLVFLELPQSVYTTPGSGDEKMAQTWWHVNGYTKTDPIIRLLLELLEVEKRWFKIRQIPAYQKRISDIDAWNCTGKFKNVDEEKKKQDALEEKTESDPVLKLFVELRCERDGARKAVLGKLYREADNLFARVGQNGARDTSEMVEAVRKLTAATKKVTTIDREGQTTNVEVDAKGIPGTEKLTSPTDSQLREAKRREMIEEIKTVLLKILSEDDPLKSDDTAILNLVETLKTRFDIKDGSEFEKAIEFIRLDEEVMRPVGFNDNIQRRTVRTVDIIPRQSSLNVNDVQETVKATGILAAFKFLFGFAGQVNFQRQREQFEQFIHQEIYASGFGKGNRDFGWTFGAVPGTKRVAPGVRTTYAALVVPEKAESIVLSARGCYFPRKSYQPLDFQDTGHTDWTDPDRFKRYNCGDENTYILTIPGGGETSNFWVTRVEYDEGKNGGEFATVSVRGKNFSSQMGVLIDGVPLSATVGLAQQHLMPKRPAANGAPAQPATKDCSSVTTICGSYERIDSEQIVFSFKMPANYVGTPTITLIAPGKAVDLNPLPNLSINRTLNGTLKKDGPFMYGSRPSSVLSIKDLQLLDDASGATQRALLIGTNFNNSKDKIYVNGTELTTAVERKSISASLYELNFPVSGDETLKVTVVQDKSVVSKAVPNPNAFKIIKPTVISYEPAAKNKPGVAVVKLEGTGFRTRIRVSQITGARLERLQTVSATVLIVRLTNLKAPIFIQLADPVTGGLASVVIESLPEKGEPEEE